MDTTSPLHETPFMHQTPEQRARDLAEFPLFAGFSHSDLVQIARRAEPFPFTPGTVIFRQGEASEEVNYLYLVGEGTLRQYGTGSLGIPWLERTLTRGSVFGRYALLSGTPQETTVEAQDYGYVYRVHAVDVSIFLARWPHLQERLIPEERIHRLRGLPLFSVLPDDHLRRLADHIVEKRLSPGTLYRIGETAVPHVWVVAEGQIAYTSVDEAPPKHFEVAEPLSLHLATVGYVFVDGPVPETGLSPQQVRAVSEAVLYGLPAPTFRMLVERFRVPELPHEGNILAFTRLPDVPARLRNVPGFAELPEEWLKHLRGFTAWIHTPRFQMVVQQGARGESLYVLDDGEAIVRAVDDRGRRRPRSYLFPGQFFGRHALLHSTQHDATIEATQPSCWLRLSREDLDRFNRYTMPDQEDLRWQRWRCLKHDTLDRWRARFQGRAWLPCPHRWQSIWERLGGVPPAVEAKIQKIRPWLEPDEEIIWLDRKHIAFFVIQLIGPALAVAFTLSGVILGILEHLSPRVVSAFGAGALVALLWLVYVIVDYLNDFYAVTDRRVVHRDRVLLLRESWEDIPLDRIQDVIRRRGLLGRLWGFGTLIVQTAAAGGTIVMHQIPSPDQTQALIMLQRSRTRAKRQAWRRERLRQDLQERLFVSTLAEWPAVATGRTYPSRLRSRRLRRRRERELTRAGQPTLWQRVRAFPGRLIPGPVRAVARWLGQVLGGLNVFGRRRQPTGDKLYIPILPRVHWRDGQRVYWRKNYFNLLRRTLPPLLLFSAASGALGFFTVVTFLSDVPTVRTAATIAVGVIWLFSLGWLVWRYDDWRNDLYVLTPDRLIDLEKRPFFLEEERREAPLSQVQNVRLQMKGLIAHIFNFGDVLIQTAAAGGDITFDKVPDPRSVVREISHYLDEFRRKQEEREYEQRQAMVAEGLEVYDELIRSRLPRSGRQWRREDM